MGRAAAGRGGDGAQGLGQGGSGTAPSLGQRGGAHEVRRGRSGTMHLGWIGALEVGGAQNGWGRGPGGAAWMQVSCRRAVLGRAELAGVHEASKKVGFVRRGRGGSVGSWSGVGGGYFGCGRGSFLIRNSSYLS